MNRHNRDSVFCTREILLSLKSIHTWTDVCENRLVTVFIHILIAHFETSKRNLWPPPRQFKHHLRAAFTVLSCFKKNPARSRDKNIQSSRSGEREKRYIWFSNCHQFLRLVLNNRAVECGHADTVKGFRCFSLILMPLRQKYVFM